ncbi:5-methyltetrahydropteroyltriglutamate--homocysteine S-methyltransferase [Humidisolicoccus flavus]|uniref:5-methyltetrahydropteroyltriglutamate-- homocysteine S-methyltransferase n=1 Tax=Humidisolicoccus flavus TaxID=3111414 RepID=UPI00324A6B45
MTTPSFPNGTILGYPRIGANRELKRALESHWKGSIRDEEFAEAAKSVRHASLARLVELGLPADDASLPLDGAHYDHVLDAILTFGAVPPRLRNAIEQRPATLADEWLLARGKDEVAPLEMTKWLDSNYHYLVPELDAESTFAFVDHRIVDRFRAAQEAGYVTRPSVVGPLTFLLLAKIDGADALALLPALTKAYAELLKALAAAGAKWVQIDEPALVASSSIDRSELIAAVESTYRELAKQGIKTLVTLGYGEAPDVLQPLKNVGVDALGLDLVRGSLAEVPADIEILAGVVSGRNVWRTDLDNALTTLRALSANPVTVATSTSLIHVPHSLERESKIEAPLRDWLAFADEKVGEVALLQAALAEESSVAEQLAQQREVLVQRANAEGVRVPAVRARLEGLDEDAYSREPFSVRSKAQQEALQLPTLPTTTIGSFPQTGEIRRSRAAHAKGVLSDAEYTEAMQAEIRDVIALQEHLGLDVLVHGEPERNDMVQYFAEHLEGFAVTEFGWVQSYGSRCTRPSLLWGDVWRAEPITVSWSAYAQSLTSQHVKGMLTGPVTILAWSFVRDDQPLSATASQVALALRDEISDLEDAGIAIVQVDEPALRELLPLQESDQASYLDWSVRSFRLATAGAKTATQIHTHLCYSEFGEVIDAIDGLDADVTSIEAARSKMDIVEDVAKHGFARGIGPGVYDIHSPRVPSEGEVTELIGAATAAIDASRLWINPDCGLKTRGSSEVARSLESVVAAAKAARAQLV